MIHKEELLGIAKFKNLPINLAESDYLQDIALMTISNQFGNRLIFKGGTCLYKVYKLDRFSEDLDFTATRKFKKEGFFERIRYAFTLLNINSRLRVEDFDTGVNAYLDLFGPLYDGTKETAKTLLFNISLRERVLLPAVRYPYLSQYNEVRPFELFVMDEKEIMAEKIRAIYTRNKARDVYDLWYLLVRKSRVLDISLVNKKLGYAKLKFDKKLFMKKVEKKRDSWDRDLSALVSGKLPGFDHVMEDMATKL